MQGLDFANIESCISVPRLLTYKQLTGSTDPVKNIAAYQWNKRVSAALHPLLQCIEVTLRNAVHNAAHAHFNQADWFDPVTKLAGNDSFSAYKRKNPHLQKFYRNGVSKGSRQGLIIWTSHHENMLKCARDKLTKAKKQTTADAVVAELMFGFWVGMFERNYSDIQTQTRLWPHLESAVFPNLSPAERVHSRVLQSLFEVKELRNRLSHHEPVWKHPSVVDAKSAVIYLQRMITEIIRLIHGMSSHRMALLHQSGVITYARGICCSETLNHYLDGMKSKKVDRRNLKRKITNSLKNNSISPFIIIDKKTPKMIVDLYIP